MRLTLIVLSFLCTLFNLQGQRMSTAEADVLIKQADFTRAKIKLDEIIDYNPYSAEAYIKRAQVHRVLGMNKESALDLSLAEYLNPLAQIYIDNQQRTQYYAKKKYQYDFEKESGQFTKSPIKIEYYRDCYQKISQHHDQDSILQQAIKYLMNGDTQLALNSIDEIEVNDRIEGILLDIRGLVEMKNNNFGNAIEYFTKSIEKMPEFPMAYHNRSICYSKLGMTDLAKQDIKNAISLNDNISLFYFTSGKINQDEKNTHQAIKDYENAIALDEDYIEARVNYSLLLKTLGNYEESMIELDYAISIDPDNLENYFLRGCMHLSYAEYRKAIGDFETYLSEFDSDADALYNLGLAQILSGEESLGCSNIEESLEESANESRSQLHKAFCTDIKF